MGLYRGLPGESVWNFMYGLALGAVCILHGLRIYFAKGPVDPWRLDLQPRLRR